MQKTFKMEMKIHEKIKEYSKSKGETIKTLAEDFGVTHQAVQQYFSGKNAMPLSFLCFYVERHPEIDLNALFDKKQRDIVSEPKAEYKVVRKKRDIIDRIVAILDEEL